MNNEQLPRIRLIPLYGDNRPYWAESDLERYAEILASVATRVRTSDHSTALSWLMDWRIYALEQNKSRFKDDRFHLLNRCYRRWRGHEISFAESDLIALGLDTWRHRAIPEAFGADIFPLESDAWQRRPGRRLRQYADLMRGLASAYSAQVDSLTTPPNGGTP